MRVKVTQVRLFATPWTAAHQAPLSMGFSRQEYWSGLPFPSPGGLPNPGIEPRSPALQADALTSEPSGKRVANTRWPKSSFHNILWKNIHILSGPPDTKHSTYGIYFYVLLLKRRKEGDEEEGKKQNFVK